MKWFILVTRTDYLRVVVAVNMGGLISRRWEMACLMLRWVPLVCLVLLLNVKRSNHCLSQWAGYSVHFAGKYVRSCTEDENRAWLDRVSEGLHFGNLTSVLISVKYALNKSCVSSCLILSRRFIGVMRSAKFPHLSSRSTMEPNGYLDSGSSICKLTIHSCRLWT